MSNERSAPRVALSLVVFAIGACIVWRGLALWSVPRDSGDPSAADRVTIDLLDLARHARVERSTRTIEFGTDAGSANYAEPDPRDHAAASGFLSFRDPKSGIASAAVVGSRASVRFTHFAADRSRALRCTLSGVGIDDGAGDQLVTVGLNGVEDVARFELPPGTSAAERMFELPADRLRRGENVLSFTFARTVRRAFPLRGEPFRWPVAAVFRSLAFDVDDAPNAPGTDLEVKSVAGVGGRPAARAATFEQGARVSFAVDLPAVRPHLTARVFVAPEDRASGRSVPITVRLVVEPVGQLHLATTQLDASAAQDERGALEIDADLSLFAGQVADLQFETGAAARGERPCRVAIAAPVIRSGATGDGPDARDARPASEPSISAERDALRERLRGMNLVVITLDAAAARRFTAYGCDHELLPAVDGLAVRGATFEKTVSSASYTIAGVGSILTGLWPDVHGVTDDMGSANAHRLADASPTLASSLAAAGYSTLALVTNPNAGAAYGYDRGFARYDELFKDRSLWHEGVAADALAPRLAKHADEGALKEPFFVYAHFFQPHAPYHAPAEFAKGVVDLGYAGPADGTRQSISDFRFHAADDWKDDDFRHLERLYDANLAFADHGVSLLLDELKRRGVLDRTIVIVVADHGEEFGEHRGVEHGDATFAEQVEVPFILWLPPAAKLAPTRVKSPGSIVDVAPTALALLSVAPNPTDARFDGIDRTPALLGASEAPRPLFLRSSGVQPRYAVRWKNATYHEDLRTREWWLFFADVDPGETRSVLDEPSGHAGLADFLRAQLCDFLCDRRGAPAPRAVIDPSLVEQAHQIGYAAGGGTGGSASAAAPRANGCPFLRREIPRH